MIIISNIENQKNIEDVMKNISSKWFGTEDYKSIIDVMALQIIWLKIFG